MIWRIAGTQPGVEFAGTSVTSNGIESGTVMDPRIVARELVAAIPELARCDTARRGYMAMTIARDAVRNDWVMVATVAAKTIRADVARSAMVARGRNVMA